MTDWWRSVNDSWMYMRSQFNRCLVFLLVLFRFFFFFFFFVLFE